MDPVDGKNGTLRLETLRPAGEGQDGGGNRLSRIGSAEDFPPLSPVQRIASAGRSLSAEPDPVPRLSPPQSPGETSLEGAREEAEARLNELLRQIRDERFSSGELRVSLDEETDSFVYKRIDPETGEVTHQIPPEEMLRLIARLQELAGLVFDRDA